MKNKKNIVSFKKNLRYEKIDDFIGSSDYVEWMFE